MNRYDFTGVAEWGKIPGWFDLAEAIAIQQIVKGLGPGSKLVELGSFQGRSSVAIAAVMPPESLLFCIDHFQGSVEHKSMNVDVRDLFQSFWNNVQAFGVRDRVCVLPMSTSEAAQRFDSESVDLILLDAAHDAVSVTQDLTNWYPKLKPGGFLICDDYEPSWPGVMQAIASVGLKGELIAKTLWMHRRPLSGK